MTRMRLVSVAAVLAFGAGVALAPVLAQDKPEPTSGSDKSDLYQQLNLFGDVLERIRRDYVEPVDEKTLMENAINGMLAALDLRVLVYDPFVQADGLEQVSSLEVLLSRSHFVSLHARATPENERLIDQAQANKELIRNLAHEIKNPLGGIRGAAQLLEMEVESKALTEYTRVIIHEADRLQDLVDRLLAPHRKPHLVADVNIHEVCERVRSLVLAEFPRGLKVVRDYDTSIPEFRGDREQLIQAVLNITHNAAQALAEGIAAGSAQIVFR